MNISGNRNASKRALLIFLVHVAYCALYIGTTNAGLAQTCKPDVVKRVRASTVFLTVKATAKDTGAVESREGTGFVISPSGFVLTTRHLVEQGDKIDSVVVSGAIADRNATASRMLIIGQNNYDLALLQFADTSKTYDAITFGRTSDVAVGTWLCAVGFPGGQDIFLATGAMSGTGGEHGFWLTNMASNPGDSGAPVFLESGKIVAVKEGGYNGVTNVNLIVPINFSKDLIVVVPDILAAPDLPPATIIPGPILTYKPIDRTNALSNSLNAVITRSSLGGNQYHFKVSFIVPSPPSPPPGIAPGPYPYNLVTIYGWQMANGQRTDLPKGTINSVPGNWNAGNLVELDFDLPQQFADVSQGWDLRFCVGSSAGCIPSPNLLVGLPVN